MINTTTQSDLFLPLLYANHKLKKLSSTYLIIYHLIYSYFILSYFILSYFTLSYLILSYLILSYLILYHTCDLQKLKLWCAWVWVLRLPAGDVLCHTGPQWTHRTVWPGWVYLSVCLSVYLSVCLPVCLSVCLLLQATVCVFMYLCVCLTVCLSVCLSTCLSACRACTVPHRAWVNPQDCVTRVGTCKKKIREKSWALGRLEGIWKNTDIIFIHWRWNISKVPWPISI